MLGGRPTTRSTAAAAAVAAAAAAARTGAAVIAKAATTTTTTTSEGNKCAYDWDVYKSRRTALLHLKRNNTHVDIVIETEDGRARELVHSQVMSAFGDKFNKFISETGGSNETLSAGQGPTAARALTKRATKKGDLRLIRLPRVNRYTLDILIECAYTGYIRTDLASGGIWQVLDVADYYEMPDVIRACCSFLSKHLNVSNCIEFYHIGIRHRHQLQRFAWHQIRANFKYILQADLEKEATTETTTTMMPANNSSSSNSSNSNNNNNNASLASIKFEHFEPLLLHDKLNIDNEESVWSAIRLWCNYNASERARYLANLLPCVRFPRLRAGTEFLARTIWRDPLIVNNRDAQHQLAVLDRNHRDFLSSSSGSAGGGGGTGRQNQSLSGLLSGVASVHHFSNYQLQPTDGGNSVLVSSVSHFRDGFNLPCSVQPRQLRPRIPHSILLAIGGWQQGLPTSLIETYDLNCNLWFESRRRITSPLAYHGIEFINSLLYICGGTDGNEILNEMFTFDPIRGDCLQRPSMREARCYVSTAHLGGYLYVMGGHNGVQRMRSVERFNLDASTWAHVHDMNVARSDASACVYQNLIYIAGGLNDQVIENSVEFYNSHDDSWTFISSMLMPRTSFTLLTFKNGLLAIGGNNGTDRLNSVEQYSFATKLWTSHSQMRHRRSTFSAALVDETKLFVVGGYNGQTPFSQVEMWDEQSRAWITMQKIRYDRSGLKVVVIKDLPNAAEYTFLGSQHAAGQYNSLNTSSSPQNNDG